MSHTERHTEQRDRILKCVLSRHDHPAADDVYRCVQRSLPRISMKTVYNNLKYLANAGLIREISVRGVKRYEPIMMAHHHLQCRLCDRVDDVVIPELSEAAGRAARKIRGFRVETTTTHFYGICKRCREKEKYE